MKKIIINKIVNYINKNGNYNNEEIEIIRYGIANLYLQITKTFVITLLAIVLNIFIPYLIFTILFSIIRMPSFGMHAKKSYQCWIFSILLFLGLPYLATKMVINTYMLTIILIICTIHIYRYSPADTEKRPIVSKKRRRVYKYLSTIISMIYSVFSLYIRGTIGNLLLASLILQCVIISPTTYKIFGLPYDNYKKYIGEEAK